MLQFLRFYLILRKIYSSTINLKQDFLAAPWWWDRTGYLPSTDAGVAQLETLPVATHLLTSNTLALWPPNVDAECVEP